MSPVFCNIYISKVVLMIKYNMKESSQTLHIGIIMDGNGRWATEQGKQRLEGHSAGVLAVQALLRECTSVGVGTVTLFAFAISNWKREKQEVDGLWILFHSFIVESSQEFIENGTRVVFIGDREGLPEHVREVAIKLEIDSSHNKKLLFQIALNYDGLDEVVRMTKKVIQSEVSAEDVTPEYLLSHLDTQAENQPDIIVRTGMPQAEEGMAVWRSSGFLPLQSTESVCVSLEVLWPDFTIEHLQKIITYAKPENRLFGGQRKEK